MFLLLDEEVINSMFFIIEDIFQFFLGVLCAIFCIYFSWEWIMTGTLAYLLKGIAFFILGVINIVMSLEE